MNLENDIVFRLDYTLQANVLLVTSHEKRGQCSFLCLLLLLTVPLKKNFYTSNLHQLSPLRYRMQK
jgi:hypothetical protein